MTVEKLIALCQPSMFCVLPGASQEFLEIREVACPQAIKNHSHEINPVCNICSLDGSGGFMGAKVCKPPPPYLQKYKRI